MRGLDDAEGERPLVQPGDGVDEIPVVRPVGVEVVPEASIDEQVDDVGEGEKRRRMEVLVEQRQDVLGADALKALRRAVPVLVSRFVPAQLVVVAVAVRHGRPDALHELSASGQRIWPLRPIMSLTMNTESGEPPARTCSKRRSSSQT